MEVSALAALSPGNEPLVPTGQESWAPEPVWTQCQRDKFPAPARNRTPIIWSSSPLQDAILTELCIFFTFLPSCHSRRPPDNLTHYHTVKALHRTLQIISLLKGQERKGKEASVTNQQILWNRILIQEPIFTQLVKKWKPKVHYHVHESQYNDTSELHNWNRV
jgi:hypothetical protein